MATEQQVSADVGEAFYDGNGGGLPSRITGAPQRPLLWT